MIARATTLLLLALCRPQQFVYKRGGMEQAESLRGVAQRKEQCAA